MKQQLNAVQNNEGESSTLPAIHTRRGYIKVSDTKRRQLLELVENKQVTIKKAALCLGINYSTAKNIIKIYHQEKRITVLPRGLLAPHRLNSTKNGEEGQNKKLTRKETRRKSDKTHNMTPSEEPSSKMISDPLLIDRTPIVFDFSIYASSIYSMYSKP